MKIKMKRHSCPIPKQQSEEKFTSELTRILALRTYFSSLLNRGRYKELKYYCMFIGYPRSGHSMVGSLLDAHPDCVIAHEADILGLIKDVNFNRYQIFNFLEEISRTFAEAGRKWSGYSYEVKGQWQGRSERLLVIGDKKGGASSLHICDDVKILEKLQKSVCLPIKYIHQIRNPFDIISSVALRVNKEHYNINEAIENFKLTCQGMKMAKEVITEQELFEFRHEDFLPDPKMYLRKICEFLELDCREEYLDSCASIVKVSPHQTRAKVNWTQEQRDKVMEITKEYLWFNGYSFDN